MRKGMFKLMRRWGLALMALSFSHASTDIKMQKIYAFLDTGGKMRMSTMRILQEYAMVGMKNHFKNPDKALKKDMKSLEKGLTELLQNCQDKKNDAVFSYTELQKAETSLEKARKILKNNPSENEALAFWEALDDIRNGINRALVHLSQELYPDDDTVQGIMYASRLATIAQRYGALYLYKIWGFDKDLKAGQQLQYLNRFFPDAVSQLAESTEDLPDALQKNIAELLKTIQNDLRFFTVMGHSKHYIPTLIYTKAQSIADKADDIADDFVNNPIE